MAQPCRRAGSATALSPDTRDRQSRNGTGAPTARHIYLIFRKPIPVRMPDGVQTECRQSADTGFSSEIRVNPSGRSRNQKLDFVSKRRKLIS